MHERALTDILKGEVLRGVFVRDGEDGGDIGKLGRFKECHWRLVPTLAAFREFNVGMALRGEDDDEEGGGHDGWLRAVREREDVAGVAIAFEYEHGVGGYVAYLIGSRLSLQAQTQRGNEENKDFTDLPLVLTRLPKPLMEMLFKYLATTFDALALPMGFVDDVSEDEKNAGLAVGWLGERLETYLEQTKAKVDKDITLNIKIPGGNGGMITLGLGRADVTEMMKYGTRLMQALHMNGRKRKGENEVTTKVKGPFFLGVEKYLATAMGIEVNRIILDKVACGSFVVGGGGISAANAANRDGAVKDKLESSGRVKIFMPRRGRIRADDDEDDDNNWSVEETAKEEFVDALVRLAEKKGRLAQPTGDQADTVQPLAKRTKAL